MTETYRLADSSQLLHSLQGTSFIGDYANKHADEVDALVASGDCFVTLATQLDALGHSEQYSSLTPEIDHVVQTLLYLQRHYAIVQRSADYRQ